MAAVSFLMTHRSGAPSRRRLWWGERGNGGITQPSRRDGAKEDVAWGEELACGVAQTHAEKSLAGEYASLPNKITAPIGFNITFPGMLSLAIGMGLEFPISQSRIDEILHLREMELKRQAGEDSHGEQAYMAYIVEGLGKLQDWDKVMKFQRRNGSLFNSPSATAATLIYNYDDKALQYLISLVTEFGSAVPTVHPLKLHCQISIVDSLERTGLSQHFSSEIKGILDITYRLWLQRDDEIILDVATCAMAFRLLRMNGYDVSSDELSHISEASTFHNSLQGYLNETKPILELYKASKVGLSEEDLILDNIGHWSSSLLKEMLSSSEVQTTPTLEQVEYALKFPFYATLDRLDHRRNIEYFDAGGSQMLKAEYLPSHVHQDILALAVEDFNFSQSMYQNELQHLDSWLKENRLDQLQFARQKLSYCYLSAASTIFTPELFDARISWCKSATLAGIVDDLFDVGGSKEELKNLIALVEKWDEHHTCEFYSEQVKIVFSALYTTVNHLGAMASAIQGRDVTEHLREIKLSDYIVKHQESNELFRLMSTCGRLLNDIKGFERDEEGNEAKLNNVSLLVLHSGGSMSIKEAKREMQKPIDTSRRDLIRLVLRDRSVVPRPCKELFWNMCKICHVYYSRTDGYSSPNEMAGAVNAVIIEPLKLQHRNTPSAIPSES
ncbi:hypothetical protein QYE76_029307 [Lolium multiflorum]|uniref:Uncharacterized protein n=1 Tax=Lolium multiflorum TaxID=4521 RepID=A0AAD8QPB1_LOLMU|nr:hypothetical protein QYE76_029307 [Lolium multiflorum]